MSPHSCECFYRIALTHYQIGEYRLARQFCERLLQHDAAVEMPVTKKAAVLRERVRRTVQREGPAGLAIVAAGVLLTIALSGMLLRGGRRTVSSTSPTA